MLFKKPKYYKDCSELPIGIFFKILETKDVNLLLIKGKHKKLLEVWESILKEYEQLTGSPEYTNQLAKTNNECKKTIRLNAIIAIYWLLHFDKEGDYSEQLAYWNVTGKDETQVRTQILQEQTKLNIDRIKLEARQKLKQSTQENKSFEDIKAIVEESRGGNYIDSNKVTVKEWIAMCKRLEEKSKAIKSISNGRGKDNGE